MRLLTTNALWWLMKFLVAVLAGQKDLADETGVARNAPARDGAGARRHSRRQ